MPKTTKFKSTADITSAAFSTSFVTIPFVTAFTISTTITNSYPTINFTSEQSSKSTTSKSATVKTTMQKSTKNRSTKFNSTVDITSTALPTLLVTKPSIAAETIISTINHSYPPIDFTSKKILHPQRKRNDATNSKLK